MSARTTRQPSRASARAEARPIAPAPPVMNATGISIIAERAVLRRVLRLRDAVIRDVAAVREPDELVELLQVTDHLFEGERHVRPPAEFCMDQRVDAAGSAAERLFTHVIKSRLETLKRDLAVRLPAAPRAPVVEVPVLRNDCDRPTRGFDDIRQIVVALIAAPGVAFLGEDAERLRR